MTKAQVNITKLTLLFVLVLLLTIPMQTASGQSTPTPSPDMIDYVDIDGVDLGIERVISLGDLGISIILLGILATLITYVAYRLVIDKLN